MASERDTIPPEQSIFIKYRDRKSSAWLFVVDGRDRPLQKAFHVKLSHNLMPAEQKNSKNQNHCCPVKFIFH
jgi:hypothetical protein